MAPYDVLQHDKLERLNSSLVDATALVDRETLSALVKSKIKMRTVRHGMTRCALSLSNYLAMSPYAPCISPK